MEFPKITVGGGVQGGAGESSSFKYGLFHEICEDYEMILGNGEIMHASATENPDLYHGTACSYGTLGIITLIKVRLIPAKKYVRLTYHQTKSLKEAIEVVGHEARGGSDFLDGIIFRPDFGVVMTGVFSDKVDLPERTFSKRSDEWFYLHAQKVSSGGASYEEIIPLREYLFRYDQATFWSAKYVFRRFRIPSIKILRTFFNPLLSAKRLYRVLHETGIAQQYIVQDIDVPEAVAASFLDFLDTTVHIYPLWLCPLRTDKHAPLSSTFLNADLVMNIGVWGEAKHDFSDFLKTNRSLETYTTNIGGRKILYAHAYYPEDEFWNVYDKSWYDALRKKYKADKTFPNIYEKVFVSKRYQPAVFKGLMRLLRKKVS
jgi:FAD/FMN-containing dehydrogenase